MELYTWAILAFISLITLVVYTYILYLMVVIIGIMLVKRGLLWIYPSLDQERNIIKIDNSISERR